MMGLASGGARTGSCRIAKLLVLPTDAGATPRIKSWFDL